MPSASAACASPCLPPILTLLASAPQLTRDSIAVIEATAVGKVLQRFEFMWRQLCIDDPNQGDKGQQQGGSMAGGAAAWSMRCTAWRTGTVLDEEGQERQLPDWLVQVCAWAAPALLLLQRSGCRGPAPAASPAMSLSIMLATPPLLSLSACPRRLPHAPPQGAMDVALRRMRDQLRLRLSEQEWTVLRMSCQDNTQQAIGNALGVSALCMTRLASAAFA